MNDKQEIAKSPESRRLAGLAAAFDAAAFSTGASSWPVTRRLLPPLAAMVLLLLAGAGGLLYRQHRQQLEKDIAADMSDTSGDLRVALEQQAAGLTMAIQPIAASPAVKKALRANDAAALLAVWRPVFEKMRRENQLTHFYFVNSNNVCLLRLHDPARRGDRLGHFTFLESGRTGRAASGIELGPLGTFTLRVVQPVFDGGKIIGYVELGEEIEKALHTLHTRSNNHLAVVIRKDLLKREAWEEGMRLLGRRADWDHLPGSVIVYASQGSLPGAFSSWAEHAAGIAAHGDLDTDISFDGRSWRLASAPLSDAAGTAVGGLLVMRDVTAEKAAFRRLLAIGGTAGAALLSLALGFIYALLRRTDGVILTRQAESVLMQEELSFKNAILLAQQEVSLDGILVVSDAGGIISFNRRFTEMWGIPSEVMRSGSDDLALQSVLDKLACPEEFLARVKHLYAAKSETSMEEISLKDGRTFDRYSAPMPGAAGKSYGRVWYFRDITERKTAEEALSRQAEELRSRNEELSRFNLVAVGRELQMIELKREVNELCGKLSEPPRYRLPAEPPVQPLPSEELP